MKSGELLPDRGGPPEVSSPEIEFALVLSRVIDSTRNDPDELRRAIYDLARYKLQEQLADANPQDSAKTQQALEIAIQGVEAFAVKHDSGNLRPIALPFAPQALGPRGTLPHAPEVEQQLHRQFGSSQPRRPAAERALRRPVYLRWAALVVAVAVVAGIAVSQKDRLRATLAPQATNKPVIRAEPSQPAPAPPPASPPPAPAPVAPDPLLPKSYGVFAVSNGKLFELQPLPGRAPDLRVAVSAAIQGKSQTVLTDGAPRFIIFRRDAGVVDNPDVRIVARIGRDFSGEPKIPGESNDIWVMRNITFPFRAGPIEGRPDMYEIRNNDDQRPLSPGRYALVLKGQAFDFSIAGKPTDRRQCLERISSANGVFYSECSNP